MWLETLKNWINEILANSPSTGTTPNPNPNYVDVGVQTDATTLWETVKQWFFEVLSVRPSELSSMGYNKVERWRNKLESIQSVDQHDSESPLTTIGSAISSTLNNLIDPNESASNISEVIPESSQQSVDFLPLTTYIPFF